MTARTLRIALPHPRAAGILAAAIGLVAATQLATLLTHRPVVGPGPAPASGAELGAVVAPDAPSGPVAELARIDRSIQAWTANLDAEPQDFLSATNLALLYEARARLSGDATDFARADDAADRALAVEPAHLPARLAHARIRLAVHDFAAALAEAESIDRTLPGEPAVIAVMGDALLELGDVDGAEARFAELATSAPGPAVTARLARLAFLRGDPAGGVEQAAAAFEAAATVGEAGPALSWYAYLNGTLTLAAGDPEAAERWYDRALDAWPGSAAALAARARVAAALDRHDESIALYERAVAINPQPDSLAALGDLYALRGEVALAEQQYETVLAVAQLGATDAGGAGARLFDRQLVRFLVDHDRDAGLALELAEAELTVRRDVYGHDALAWALLANGRAAEANEAMARALGLGTRDASLLYHAGVIAAAVGDVDRAEALLRDALGIRGALDPVARARAIETLHELEAGS